MQYYASAYMKLETAVGKLEKLESSCFKKALVSFQLQRELSFSIFPNVLSNYMYKVGQINDESVPDINKLIFRQP